MNPLVAEYIGLMPISPVDYVWFDTTYDSGFMDSYTDWWNSNLDKLKSMDFVISDLPVPFEKMAIMVTIASKETLDRPGCMPILFERKGSSLFIRQYIKGLSEPSIECEFQDQLLATQDDGIKSKYFMKFHPVYLNAIGKKKEDDEEIEWEQKTIDIALKKLILLCYGIPKQGSTVEGYKLSCTPREEQRNVKKRVKGKCQLFEWKTVELKVNPLPKEYVPLGGTHASPKPHERRGHQRRYKNGKVVYVRQSTINKHLVETEGFIHHDYKVTGTKQKKNWFHSVIDNVRNLFKEKLNERVSKAKSRERKVPQVGDQEVRA